MFREFRLENFKAFGESQTLPVRPITLIFGPNSSGKSSIIQSLLMLKQTLEESQGMKGVLLSKGSQVDLGSFRDFIHGHDPEKQLKFRIDFDVAGCVDNPCFEDWIRELKLLESLHEHFPRIGLAVTLGRDVDELIALKEMVLLVGDKPLATFKPPVWPDEQIGWVGEDEITRLPECVKLDSMSPDHGFWEWLWDFFGAERLREIRSMFDAKLTELRSKPEPDEAPRKREEGNLFVQPLTPNDRELIARIESMETVLADYGTRELPVDYQEFGAGTTIRKAAFCPFQLPPAEGADWGLAFPNVERLTEPTEHPVKNTDLTGMIDPGERELGAQMFDDAYYTSDMRALGYKVLYDKYSATPIGMLWTEFLPGNLLASVGKLVKQSLDRLVYLGPLRTAPERYYVLSGTTSDLVGRTGQWTAQMLYHNPELLDKVNERLKRFKLGYRLKITPLKDEEDVGDIFALRLVEDATGITVNGTDVGFGISQVLPIVVQSMLSEEKTICIEQPEIHLHPGLQAEMGDLFIDAALGDRKNTFILETHSEHLILRILRRIRETTNRQPNGLPRIRPEDVQVIYAEPRSDGTRLWDLPITANGDFAKKWPKGFFPERADELFS